MPFWADPVASVLSGGLLFAAVFMATDYVTCPVTDKAQYVYALLLGLLTWVFRLIGKSAEGVSYAIIFMNCLVPLIENYTKPLAFGIQKEKKDKKKEGAKA